MEISNLSIRILIQSLFFIVVTTLQLNLVFGLTNNFNNLHLVIRIYASKFTFKFNCPVF